MTYYCHRCAETLGHLTNVYTSDPLQSTYQLGKFLKHTVPGTFLDSSVFNSTSTGPYGDYIVSAAASGAVELDDRGRRNFIWLAGKQTGFEYKDAVLIGPTDGVKVVLSSEEKKVHAFPVVAAQLMTRSCASCGKLIAS
jgi:hypothetical protein